MDFLLPGLKDSWIAGFGLLRLDFQDAGSLDLDFSFGFSGCWIVGSGLFLLDFQDIGVDRDVKMFNISGLLSGFRISANFPRRLAINHRRLVAQLPYHTNVVRRVCLNKSAFNRYRS